MKYGVEFPLSKTFREDKLKDVLEALDFRNHKGVKKLKPFFEQNLDDDIRHGFSLPIPLNQVRKLKNALLAPMHVIKQDTINERGEIIDKKRITHNQSKKYNSSGTFVNSRVDKDKLLDCIYGPCLLQVIHAIVELRRRHPTLKI